MAAITKNLVIDQGANFSYKFTAYKVNFEQDGSLSVAASLSGYTIAAKLKTSHTTTAAGVTFDCEVVSAPSGTFKISLDDSVTVTLEPRRYVYDVMATSNNGTKYKLYEGIATVVPTVTK